jgi:hypothetical protein
MYSRKPSNAAICAKERRRLEDESPRIAALFPELVGLKIAVEERSATATPKYVRRIVVESAPAVFLLPCSDPHCSDGGHDVSTEILAALRQRLPTMSGSHQCAGTIGSANCQRRIWFDVEAEYRVKSST